MQPKLGVIAGDGELPSLIIQSCLKSGRDFFVIAFEGQADHVTLAGDVPHAWVRLGAAGTTLKLLHEAGVEELVMAGGIKRPALKDLRPDLWATKFLAATGAASLGDDGLLKLLIKALEGEGFRVIGVDQLLPDILAPAGVYGVVLPGKNAQVNIRVAQQAAISIGAKDQGQGAIAYQAKVLSVEDKDGTDAMIRRLPNLRNSKKGGVLVKVCKPGQETRADLPTIGVSTIEVAAKAGLEGVAVQAGKALIVDMKAVVSTADQHGLFVVGIEVESPMIYIIAGEASGDLLGARVMSRLKEKNADIRFVGIGGAKMTEQGLDSLFPMEELSLMGLTEIIPHLPMLYKRIKQTISDVLQQRPDMLLSIDSPGFCFHVAKRLKGKNIKLVHYVAPSVWAWKPGRAKKVSGFLDLLLVLLPFEPPYFEQVGLATTFVGHSVVEGGADKGDGKGFRKRHNIASQSTVLVMLPGSRRGEVNRLLDVFGRTALYLSKDHPDMTIVIPVFGPLFEVISDGVKQWSVDVRIVEGDKEKFDAFAAADIALAASGTVALELAMAGTPTVIGYKVHPVSAWLVKRLIKTTYVNLINIVLNREVVPELLQENCRPDLLQKALTVFLDDKNAGPQQIKMANEALQRIGRNGPLPSARAADAILSIFNKDN
jgi:lipid-A-disaccharide synthase